jgi:hypothetical protein
VTVVKRARAVEWIVMITAAALAGWVLMRLALALGWL